MDNKMLPLVLALSNSGGGVSKEYVDEKIKEVELFKFPNATIIGNPTINNGQISDFSNTDYLEFPFLVDFRDRAFEINFQITTGSNIVNQENILDSDYGLAFAIRNKHLVLALSFNGTSWATEQTGALELETNTTYKIKISWNRLSYKVRYSIDGGSTYFDDITFGSTQAPYPKQMYIGVGKLANNHFSGIINLNYADVKISDTIIWQGMDDVGLATRLATDLSNIDEAGKEEIKKIVGDKQDRLYIQEEDYCTIRLVYSDYGLDAVFAFKGNKPTTKDEYNHKEIIKEKSMIKYRGIERDFDIDTQYGLIINVDLSEDIGYTGQIIMTDYNVNEFNIFFDYDFSTVGAWENKEGSKQYINTGEDLLNIVKDMIDKTITDTLGGSY